MEIFNLLGSYKKTLSNIREISEQIAKKTTDIASIEKKAEEDIARIEKEELAKRTELLGDFVTSQTAELSDKIERLKQEKAAQSKKYEEDRESLTEAAVSDDYVDDQAVIDEVQMVLSNVKDSLRSAIGVRTYDKLEEQIEYSSESMSAEEIQSMIDYFNDSESILILISKIKNPFLFLIQFIERFNIEDREITSKYVAPIFCVAYAVMFVLLSKFVFSFVAFGLILTFVYGIVSTYFLHKMLVAAVVIQTNLDTVIDDLHKQILDDRDDRIVNLDNEYTMQMEEFQNEINSVMLELQNAEDNANQEFGFDNAEFRQRKDSILLEKKSRLDVLNTEVVELRKKASSLSAEREEMEKKVKNCIDHIQDDLCAVGNDKKLDPLFLMDVNPETYAISSFEFPMDSFLCIYDETQSMYDFINLFCMQLRSKMNPFSFKITVCDPVNMGSACLKFVSSKDDVTEQNMFRILDSESAIHDEFVELKGVIRKKNKVILSTSPDIEAYNEFMMSIESITELYEFYFVVNPSQSLYQSPEFIQIVQNGSKVGMYVLTFTSIKRMKEDGNTGLKLVDKFSAFYKIARGNVKPLTKKAIVDNFAKK